MEEGGRGEGGGEGSREGVGWRERLLCVAGKDQEAVRPRPSSGQTSPSLTATSLHGPGPGALLQ